MNEKMRHEKIMSCKIKAFICFEHTITQKDSEKIFVTTNETFQKIFWKMENFSRYFGLLLLNFRNIGKTPTNKNRFYVCIEKKYPY